MIFADVILPLPLQNTFTYEVPLEYNKLKRGMRVVVQFGKTKYYTALVYKIHSKKPFSYRAKFILSVLDDKPIINNNQFKLWSWLSDYYCCYLESSARPPPLQLMGRATGGRHLWRTTL